MEANKNKDFTIKHLKKGKWLIKYQVHKTNNLIYLLWAAKGVKTIKCWEE